MLRADDRRTVIVNEAMEVLELMCSNPRVQYEISGRPGADRVYKAYVKVGCAFETRKVKAKHSGQ